MTISKADQDFVNAVTKWRTSDNNKKIASYEELLKSILDYNGNDVTAIKEMIKRHKLA